MTQIPPPPPKPSPNQVPMSAPMSGPLDKEGCFLVVLTMAVVILLLDMCLDLYTGRRDFHHIQDLQRRVAVLEQQLK